VAIVDGDRRIRAQRVRSQDGDHRPYGGIVPEIAARRHIDRLDGLIVGTLREAAVALTDLDAIAATAGPGLIGGLAVGLTMGKALAAVSRRPFLAVNHLEGHALSVRLVADVAFPYLLLLVSGGHTQLLVVEGVGRYRRLGTTVDDAVGEAFDKVAKLIGLGYPGGPAIERLALGGDPARYKLPRPMAGRPGCDLSFSGLKTAVRHLVAGFASGLDDRVRADIAASFQAAVADSLADRTGHAIEAAWAAHPALRTLVVAGGVAANRALRRRLALVAQARGLDLIAPPQALCTDNGAMIAWAGIERLREGLVDGLDFAPRPRWPLDPRAPPSVGAGVKA
jgi:N6-L-threonylcarbamoyladenine synthase